eukprot:GHUV01002893.1.p1 GENE.GHUV01002893.1~~GHUV01002893.1.p1  ORF type:complete len:649 (+),score=226.31 GHUV01002893.1:292-1947(+)
MAAARDLAKKEVQATVTRTATEGTADRTSMESDRSDRFRNAAAASKEDSVEDPAALRAAAVDSAAYRSMAAAMPSSAAAADAQQWHYMQQQQQEQAAWPEDSVPTSELFPGGMAPAADSVGDAQGSGGSLATIDYYAQNDSGGGRPGHGSGDTVATLDENSYQPWAEAVAQDADDPNSPGSPGISRRHSMASPAGHQQQHLQEQHQHTAQDATQQQQRAVPAASQYPYQQVLEAEIQPAVDHGMVQTPAAVGPGYPSQGHIDEQQLRLQDLQQGRAAQPAPARGVAQAAQGFVEAIEMVSRPGTAGANSPPVAAGPPIVPFAAAVPGTSRQIPYHYQQRPMMLQPGGNSAGVKAGSPGNMPTLLSGVPSGLASGCSSISTGTLPAVIGDSPSGSCATSLPGSFTGPGSLPGQSSSARWVRSSGSSRREGSGSTSTTGLAGPGSPSPAQSGMPPLPQFGGARHGVPSPGGGGTPTAGGVGRAHNSLTQGSPFARAVVENAPAGAGSGLPAVSEGGAARAGAERSTGGSGPPATTSSPFAMLAHRGESLFQPL